MDDTDNLVVITLIVVIALSSFLLYGDPDIMTGLIKQINHIS